MHASEEKEPVTVVKIGGNAAVDAEGICDDVAQLVEEGRRVVIVHGGSAEIERLADQMGVPQTKHVAPDGVTSRRTDEKTMEVVTLALAGSVKPKLIRALARRGIRAMGMTGMDGHLIQARRKKAQRAVVDGRTVLVRDNLAGTIEHVETGILHLAMAQGIVPVISPPAMTLDGEALNVDADRAAAAVAAAVGADELVLLTGADGVQAVPDDPSSVLSEVEVEPEGPPPRWARGGMALKLVAAREALTGGVRRVIVANGRGSKPVREALDGSGTQVKIARSERRAERRAARRAA
ncbi:[LysW]-aminoadipate kinase [Paractinoplanes ferrugineus]|uniref:Acetylglutamate kinase n=1 Tax=Paractinoplanes ferrugineus TaxID=113564 RepID=A0A919MI61_9ACTN|nr:[LysW]-aminoadipate kinase [Actinoplanes ferrugineus]GIE13350.1 acetylglutamate kinase [Actinoplanes ferrugineus]